MLVYQRVIAIINNNIILILNPQETLCLVSFGIEGRCMHLRHIREAAPGTRFYFPPTLNTSISSIIYIVCMCISLYIYIYMSYLIWSSIFYSSNTIPWTSIANKNNHSKQHIRYHRGLLLHALPTAGSARAHRTATEEAGRKGVGSEDYRDQTAEINPNHR